MIDLYQGDCLDEMDKVADHTVNMILRTFRMAQRKKHGMCRSFLMHCGSNTGAY